MPNIVLAYTTQYSKSLQFKNILWIYEEIKFDTQILTSFSNSATQNYPINDLFVLAPETWFQIVDLCNPYHQFRIYNWVRKMRIISKKIRYTMLEVVCSCCDANFFRFKTVFTRKRLIVNAKIWKKGKAIGEPEITKTFIFFWNFICFPRNFSISDSTHISIMATYRRNASSFATRK